MSPLLSAGDITSVRAALGVLLTHTYTRTPNGAGSEDSWGDTPSNPGAPTTSVPCRYEAVTRAVRDAGGTSVVTTPTLAVDPSDPLTVGDQVSAITGSDGVVLLAGPLRVERLYDDTAGLGAALQPRWELRGVTEQATS